MTNLLAVYELGKGGGENRSAVRHPVFLDVVAVGLEQPARAAVFADRLGGPLDHAVALAGLLVFDLAAGRDLEALFSARFGLHFGHFALLSARLRASPRGRSMLTIELKNAATAALYWPVGEGRRYGRGCGGLQPCRPLPPTRCFGGAFSDMPATPYCAGAGRV